MVGLRDPSCKCCCRHGSTMAKLGLLEALRACLSGVYRKVVYNMAYTKKAKKKKPYKGGKRK